MPVTCEPIVLPNLFGAQSNLDALPWTYFREGIDIHLLHGDLTTGPAAALLRYRAGACLPTHRHADFEHILILRGSQRDENGSYFAGALVVNPPGTSHSVVSDDGCVVLAFWAKPVQF